MKKIIITTLSLLIIFLWLLPLIWLLTTSFTPEAQVLSETFSLFPKQPTIQNYLKAFSSTNIFRWLINSMQVSFFATLATLVLNAPIAYAFAKISFTGKKFLFWIVMAGMMVPFQILVIPLYLELNTFGLINTLTAAVLPRLAFPIGVLILKQFMEGIPSVLEEASFVDGASRYTTFIHIILPLAKSSCVTIIIITFISTWNDFLWPLIVINDTIKYTITVGIANFQGTHGTEYAFIMAGACVASLPQFIFYAFFRKNIVEGIAMTGVKG